MEVISAVSAVGAIYSTINDAIGKGGSPKEVLQKGEIGSIDTLYKTQGSITKLLSEFVVEPLLVISEDAMDNGTITDKMANIMLDIFTGYYLQAFSVMSNVYNIDAKTIVSVLATDNGYKNLKSKALKTAIGLVTESANSNHSDSYMRLLDLHTESALDNKLGSAKIIESKNGVLGNAVLNRNIEVEIVISKAAEKKLEHKISIPITIKARLVKVTAQNIIDVASPNKKIGSSLTSWLDYKAGLASFYDFVFQTKAVKKYKENRLKGNEFLEILNSRKLSAHSKLATNNVIGYELNYNLLILTDNDKNKIEKSLGWNIFKEREKDLFLNSVYSITTAVMDEGYETVTILTPDIRGLSTVSYKEIKNMNSKSNNDMTDLVKAILTNKTLF